LNKSIKSQKQKKRQEKFAKFTIPFVCACGN
jgi:hypothetical protein